MKIKLIIAGAIVLIVSAWIHLGFGWAWMTAAFLFGLGSIWALKDAMPKGD